MLTVQLLGPVEVAIDGEAVDLGGPQQRAVVAHLALDLGKVVSVERLIDRIWGDEPPRTPLATLQSYVSRLRRAIEPDRAAGTAPAILVSEAPGYLLRVEPDQVDVHRFRTLVAEARRAADDDDPAAAVERFDAALALWRGPALAGIGPDDLVRPVVVRLEEERAAAVEERFDALLVLGRHKELIAELQAAVDSDPLREGLWVLLAHALYRDSRQADALRALSRAREILLEELGLDPGPELRDIEARILAHDPTLLGGPPAHVPAPHPAAAEAPPRPSTDHGLVGRTAEWEALSRALAAAEHRAALVLLEGEPGIGKSTLCEVFLGHAASLGWHTAVGRCVEPGLAPTLWPCIEIARSLIPASPDEDAPSAWQRLTSGKETSLAVVELADGFVRLLDDHAADGCVVLVDDLHWADQSTLDLLQLVLTRLGDRRVLVIAAFRPPDLVPGSLLGAALAGLHRAVTSVTRLPMAPLDPAGVARLIEATTGVAPSDDVARRVQARAGGNPLFVAELARLAGERGLADDSVVPDAIRDVVRSRLAALPVQATAELEVAAVLGERFDVRTVMAASERDPDSCLDALDAAIVTRILVPEANGFRFTHALVRDAVLSEIPALRRARLHQRAADAILSIQGDVADAAEPVAHHRLASAPFADPVRVAAAAVRASDVARWRNAFETAEWFALQALAVLDQAAPTPEASSAEVNALEALLGLADRRRDRAFSARTAEFIGARAERTGHPGPTALSLFIDWGDIDASPDLLSPDMLAGVDRARRLAARTADRYATLVCHYMMGAHAFSIGHLEEATAHLDVAVEATGSPDPDATPDHVPVVLLPLVGGVAYAVRGRPDDARANAHRRSRSWLAQRAEVDPAVSGALAFTGAITEALLGDPRRVLDEVRHAGTNEGPGFILAQGAALALLAGWASARLGDLSVVPSVRAALEELDRSPELTARSALRTFAAEALLVAGDPGAVDLLAQARREADTRGERWWQAETIRLQAVAAVRFATGEDAAALLDEAERLATEQGAGLLLPRIAASRVELCG